MFYRETANLLKKCGDKLGGRDCQQIILYTVLSSRYSKLAIYYAFSSRYSKLLLEGLPALKPCVHDLPLKSASVCLPGPLNFLHICFSGKVQLGVVHRTFSFVMFLVSNLDATHLDNDLPPFYHPH